MKKIAQDLLDRVLKEAVPSVESLLAAMAETDNVRQLGAAKEFIERKKNLQADLTAAETAITDLDETLIPLNYAQCQQICESLRGPVQHVIREDQAKWQAKIDGLLKEVREIAEAWKGAVFQVAGAREILGVLSPEEQMNFGKLSTRLSAIPDVLVLCRK